MIYATDFPVLFLKNLLCTMSFDPIRSIRHKHRQHVVLG